MGEFIGSKYDEIIKRYDPNSVTELLSDCHCKILQADLDVETGGCTVSSNRCYTIIINENWDQYYQQFVMLHELAHIKLHSGASTPFYRQIHLDTFVSKMECEANELALRLLIYINKDNLAECTSKYEILKRLGLPSELERFLIL